MRSVPVLMYHHVLPKAGFIASSVEQFESQMRYLAETGWKTLSSDEFHRYKCDRYAPPKRSLLITFDDGWKDNLVYAYPILKRYGLKATLFVVTQWVDRASERPETFEPLAHSLCKQTVPRHPGKVLLTWNELESIRDVFDIHSHTHTHRDGYFGHCDWDEDLALSRERLQKRLGIDSTHLCWPRGRYDASLMEKAAANGYNILYTTRRGINVDDGNCREIRRLSAKKDDRWLKKNLEIFRRPLLGSLYARIKPE